jgi:threonine/homoserine/homoserine lactone efflux protein
MSELVAFLAVAALVIMTPGPDTVVTVRSTLVGGRRAGVVTAAGVVTGQACWTVAASAGVTALLIASEPAFLAVKHAGAAYVIYLGLAALVAAITGRDHTAPAGGPAVPRMTAYRQGLLSDLSNPKMAAFFTSLLPQFGSSFAAMLAFGPPARCSWRWGCDWPSSRRAALHGWDREAHPQLGAAVRGLPVVEAVGEAADQGESEPEAGRVVAGGHAAALVAHDDLDLLVVHADVDADGPRLGAVTVCMDDDVGDGL